MPLGISSTTAMGSLSSARAALAASILATCVFQLSHHIAQALLLPTAAMSNNMSKSMSKNMSNKDAPRSGCRGGTRSTIMSAATDASGGGLVALESAAKTGAVIVGGGPSGMATALMLAKRGWTNISVIEKSPSADYYDPTVAFVYNIDKRGQTFTDAHDLTQKLAAVSVDSSTFTLTKVQADGQIQELSLPVIDDSRPLSYWLPRSVFQQLLYDELASKYSDQVRVFFSSSCDSIERVPGIPGGIEVRATLQGDGGLEKMATFRPRLVVGADGLKSMVRQSLRKWEETDSDGKTIKPGKGRFDMRKQPSESTGLRYKVLTLPSGFRLGHNDAERAKSQKAYAIISKFQDPKRALRLGVLPLGPEGGDRQNAPRGGNFITRPGHALWDIKTVAELKTFLSESFPQIPITDEIGDDELGRFVQAPGGRFPSPQYCPGLQWVVGGSSAMTDQGKPGNATQEAGKEATAGAGVVLLGDAIHSFPPDLGQGVNSALEDVQVLERALDSCGDRVEAALPQYESWRQADSKALITLCQVGYPWQYKQPAFLGPKLWSANFILRTLVLNRIFPKFFGQQIFMMIQTGTTMRYSEMLESANRTTRRIVFTAASIALAVVFRRRLACSVAAVVVPALDALCKKTALKSFSAASGSISRAGA